jgi:hypothetical protein
MVNKVAKRLGMDLNVKLTWIMQGEGAKYLGVLVGFHFFAYVQF